MAHFRFSKLSIKRAIAARALLLALVLTSHMTPVVLARQHEARKPLLLVAHRGASAYAPEHTLAAYELAIKQGADFVEQDLQVTKDGALICAHDADLARTTNVEEVFPDRATLRDPEDEGKPKRGYFAIDFTLAEIKRLDAGSWFNQTNPFAARASYVGQRVPTLEEAIRLVGKRAGLYIEMKHFPFYKSLGYDLAEKLAAALARGGFAHPDRRDKVFIQSFSKESLLRMRTIAPRYFRVQLLPMEDPDRKEDSGRVTARLATEIAAYAGGVGPSKKMISGASDIAIFHAAGLLVHPYTFRGPTLATTRRPLDESEAGGLTVRQNIIEEIERFVGFGIDGGFTDYPDLWKEAVQSLKAKQKNKKRSKRATLPSPGIPPSSAGAGTGRF